MKNMKFFPHFFIILDIVLSIEEGRAASKRPQTLAIFFLFPSKQLLSILLKIQQYLNLEY
jgi:hypothetical protein